MNEIWKAIAGYEGLYEVSDKGRVKSLHRGKEMVLNPGKNHNGYLHVILCKDGHRKTIKVHRLVACAFIPNPQGLETVNHKDEIKTNNAVSNLEWMSNKDNLNYGTHNKRMAKTKSKQVQMLDKYTGELIATFPSALEAKKVTGTANQNISACCLGKLKSAGGYIWRYL